MYVYDTGCVSYVQQVIDLPLGGGKGGNTFPLRTSPAPAFILMLYIVVWADVYPLSRYLSARGSVGANDDYMLDMARCAAPCCRTFWLGKTRTLLQHVEGDCFGAYASHTYSYTGHVALV